ncbi:MAG: electron transport complex subunit E [Thermodesulfobacteriota bacterium]|nr:MAG: electron transport complex subunit E [Thermodesulfobacteriota bacterium]
MAVEQNASLAYEFKKGLWQDIAPFRLVLGLCPSLAVTNSVINGLSMGLATLGVLFVSCVIVSFVRKLVAPQVRIAAYVVIIATIVTVTDLFLQAKFPPISKALGPYVPLIITNCIILARVEAFAQKNPVLPTMMDSLGTGLGFTFALIIISIIRELLGFGSILNIHILGSWFRPWIVMILPAGAFLVMGGLIATVNYISHRSEARQRAG